MSSPAQPTTTTSLESFQSASAIIPRKTYLAYNRRRGTWLPTKSLQHCSEAIVELSMSTTTTTSPRRFFPATTQYTSSQFVEIAGAIPFSLSSRKICLVYHRSREEWLLANGRRKCGESLADAAVREVQEEVGCRCRLLPVTMATRAPPAAAGEVVDVEVEDEARVCEGVTEPFMLTVRELEEDEEEGGGGGVKLISWYIAGIEEGGGGGGGGGEGGKGEGRFEVGFFGYEEAVEKLTFRLDREVVQRAMEIVTETYGYVGFRRFLR